MSTGGRFLLDAKTMRQAIVDSIQEYEGTPEAQFLYVPTRHTQALSPRTSLVVGIRGAGKSVYWQALQDDSRRKIVSQISADWRPEKGVEVSAGFGPVQRSYDFPDRLSIAQILENGCEAYTLWRAIVLDHVSRGTNGRGPLQEQKTWVEKTAWVRGHPEEVANALFERDAVLHRDGKTHLILFDALDRLADGWERTQKLVRGLLQIMLDLRGYRAIRAKVFLRPDMVEDRNITAFPDASKILADRVNLEWGVLDLYSLLWHRLGNAPAGAQEFRELTVAEGGGEWREYADTWMVPTRLQRDESLQRRVLSKLASDYMGKSKKHGVTYTWLPKHLADTANQVSPRSFLAALRYAAEKTKELTEGSSRTLHYTAIQHGVREVSRIRVNEIG